MHIIMQPVFSHNLTLRIVVCGVYRLQQQWQLRCVTHFRVWINEGATSLQPIAFVQYKCAMQQQQIAALQPGYKQYVSILKERNIAITYIIHNQPHVQHCGTCMGSGMEY